MAPKMFLIGSGDGWFRISLAMGVLLAGLMNTPAEEVPRTPPAVYEEKLRPLLTPLEDVLAKKDTFTSKDGTGAVLLDEEVDFVDEEGRYFNVEHMIYRSLTEDGCKALGKDTFYFRRADQKIYLILARTILPDGSKREIQPNAAFFKSPQYDAGNALYDDGGELIVMYPNVDVGAITEAIVMTEQPALRIPGEYTRRFNWRAGWPKVETRRVIDLPSSLADRVKITTLGDGVPEGKRETPAKDRTRLTWTENKRPSDHWEEDMPPAYQAGPYTWLTTMDGWESISKWYADLLKGRETLSPELASQVDEWTKDAKTPREIIDILTEKVSREVRYVALEFGLAGFQPSDCNAVWNNRYGDCKDKANLLRAMLKHKGVAAKLVLLDTGHAGKVEKRSADYRQFDHMILTAEAEPGKWIYIDPTIRYGRAGLLAPVDADRDVLLLDGENYEWARTPPAEGGTIGYDFNLKRDGHGDLTGWVTMHSTGFYATSYHEDYLGKDREGTVRLAGNAVRSFFPSAEIMDVEVKKGDLEKDGFSYKAYLVVPSGGQETASTVTMPFHRSLLPSLTKDGKRQTPSFFWRDLADISLNLELPAGVKPLSIPPPYQVSTPGYAADGMWSIEGNRLKGTIRLQLKDSLVTPTEYPVFKNAVNSFESWVERPVTLGTEDGQVAMAEPTATPKEVTVENFPMMPTAGGQRDLLEKVFPPDGSVILRRKALEKIQQYFPNDKETKFYAGMNLAQLEANEKKQTQAAEAMEKLISLYRGGVDPWWTVWGEYRLAFVYLDMDKTKAQALFAKIAEEEAADDFRKAWSYYHAANLNVSPKEAVALLQKGITLDTEALQLQLPLLARLLVKDGQLDALREPLGRIAGWQSEEAEQGLVKLAESSANLSPEEEAALQKLIAEAAGENEAVAEAIKQARQKSAARAVWAGMQEKLGAYVKEHPEVLAKDSGDKSVETLLAEIKASGDASQADQTLALNMALLMKPDLGDEFPNYLWRAASRAEWVERVGEKGRTGALLPLLLALCAEAPRSHDVYHEGKFVEGQVLKLYGEDAKMEALLVAAMADPEFNPAYENSFRRELGGALERQGKKEEALEVYLALRGKMSEYTEVCSILFRAVFLLLDTGKWDDAIALLTELGGVPETVRQEAKGVFQLDDMIKLAATPDVAREYWKAGESWMNQWNKMAARVSPEGKARGPIAVPVVQDLYALGQDMGTAARGRNREALLRYWNLTISAARWSPAIAIEAASMTQNAMVLFSPGPTSEVNGFFYDMLKTLPDAHGRSRDVLLAGLLFDLGRAGEAMPLVRKVLADGPVDEVNHTMRRIWGLVGWQVKSEREGAIAALKETLAMPDATLHRVQTVNILAQLYRLDGRVDDEAELLQRELEHPRNKASDAFSSLQERARTAKEGSSGSKELTDFLKEWMEKYKPAWYDYARPARIDQAAFGDFAKVLEAPEKYFDSDEVPKFQLLVAQAGDIDYEQRLTAFKAAWTTLADFLPLESQLDEYLDGVLGSKRLNDTVQRELLWGALYAAAMGFHQKDFARLEQNPLVAGYDDWYKEALAALKVMANTDPQEVKAVEASFNKLAGQTASHPVLTGMRLLYLSMLRLGDLDAAQRMYDRLDQVTIEQGLDISTSGLKLDYLKLLKQARRWLPLQEALRTATLKHFPAESIKRPENYGDLRLVTDSNPAYVANALEIQLYRILKRQIDPSDIEFWAQFARNVDAKKDARLRAQLSEILIDKAPDDQGRAAAVYYGGSVVDLDDAEERKTFLSLGESYRDAEKWPLTSQAFLKLGAIAAYRAGDVTRYEEDVLKAGVTGNQPDTDLMAVEYHYVRNDRDKLKAALAEVNIDKLLKPASIAMALGAFDLAGMEDEAALAREQARKELYRLVLQTWLRPDGKSTYRALLLAIELDDPAGIPAAWIEDMERWTKDKYSRMNLLIGVARLKKDWAGAAEMAAKAMASFPSYYHFYFARGEALYHLGRKEEALEPLKIFAARSGNERECWVAQTWIDEIEAGKTQVKQ